MNRNRFSLVALILSACLAPFGALAQPVPLGPETRVDTLEGRLPGEPFLAVQPSGEFEIAWGYVSTTPPFVAARHFAADGTPTAAAQVALGGPGSYASVNAVTATPGGFEVLWQLIDWPRAPNYRRHLNLLGVPDPGKAVRLGKTAFSTRWVWQVRGHGFFGGWPVVKNQNDIGLAIQRLTPAGVLTGAVQRLNTRPVIVDERPILTALPNGGFVAAWRGIVRQPDFSHLYVLRARLFSPSGKPLGPDFDVNTIVPSGRNGLYYPQVAIDPQGGFALAWALTDGSPTGFTPYLRFFDADASPRGPETPFPKTQFVESIAFDDAGNLLVLWHMDGSFKVQLFDSDGVPQGPPASAASEASGEFKQSLRGGDVAWGGTSWIVTWVAEASFFGPHAIFVRRFEG